MRLRPSLLRTLTDFLNCLSFSLLITVLSTISFTLTHLVMKDDPEFVILKHTAWLDAKEFEPKILGAIIRYPLQPAKSYVPKGPRPLHYNSETLDEKCFRDFVQDNTHASSSEIFARFEKLLTASFRGHRDESVRVAGKLVRCKRLQQQEDFWDKLKVAKEVQEKVPGWVSLLNDLPPCLVVGIMTAEDVIVKFKTGASKETEVEVQVPAAEAASGGLAAAPAAVSAAATGEGSSPANPTVGGKTKVDSRTSFIGATIPDEAKIFALELLVVTTKLFQWQTLKLKEEGPDIPDGRIAGATDDSGSMDDAERQALMHELELEGFSDADLEVLDMMA